MEQSETILNYVREYLADKNLEATEKKMFGGICVMLDDKMLVGVNKERLMVRHAPELTEQLAEHEGFSQMIHGGKAMPGFSYIAYTALDRSSKVHFWLDLALAYNSTAKSSKKR